MTTRDELYRLDKSTTGDLFTHAPGYIADFVCRSFSGEIPRDELTHHQMLWYSIASTAKLYAFTSGVGPCEVDLEWARLANMTYEYLSELPGREHMMASWMGLKVRLIACLGDLVDEQLATPREVFEWFESCLTMPYDEVRRLMSGPERTLTPEQSLAIGALKESTRLIYFLRHTREYNTSPEYQRWVDLFRFETER